MFLRCHSVPVPGSGELGSALPLRELPASNFLTSDNLDLGTAQRLFLQPWCAALFCLVARGETRVLRELWLAFEL